MKKLTLLGIDLVHEKNKITDHLTRSIRQKNKFSVITLNSVMLFHYFVDRNFRKAVHNSYFIIPEGIGVSLIARLFNQKIDIFPGIDLLCQLFRMAERKGFTVFLLGGKQPVIEKAFQNIKKKYPRLKIKGRAYGYLSEGDKITLFKHLKTLKPDILIVGMGSVRQENYIYENWKKIQAIMIIGVGGSFDILSGYKKRAPVWVRDLHLEWLYRSLLSPRKIIDLFKICLLLIIVLYIKITKGEKRINKILL
ncbi:MAG: WecB/TagA/CpsF family glycosyltransferase [Spirochaetes bacterium]|nr:WecB/TagA/CpsF family glycosyltransferase [Spirochaetota bacterium]